MLFYKEFDRVKHVSIDGRAYYPLFLVEELATQQDRSIEDVILTIQEKTPKN